MNVQETKLILAVLKAAYPASFRNLTSKDANSVVSLWADMFSVEDYALVSAAVKSLISSRTVGYSPTIGEVREKITELTNPDRLTPFEAWRLVMRAASNSGYHAQEEYDKLPPLVQKALRGPETLREYAMMDAEQLNTVIASNFRKSFEIMCKREETAAMLPEDVKTMIGSLSDKLAWIGD